MSALLFIAALDVKAWFGELELQGIRITDAETGKKLYEEAGEFKDNPSLEEAADCFIALMGAVDGAGWTQDQLARAVTAKMAINRKRKWERQPDGTFHHVKCPECDGQGYYQTEGPGEGGVVMMNCHVCGDGQITKEAVDGG